MYDEAQKNKRQMELNKIKFLLFTYLKMKTH